MFTPLERLNNKILPEPNSGCWLWTGGVNEARGGYGQVHFHRKMVYVHRLVYELLIGSIPEDYEIDHTCFVRCCVNPAHLRPIEYITHREMPKSTKLSDTERRRRHNENNRLAYQNMSIAKHEEYSRRKSEYRKQRKASKERK